MSRLKRQRVRERRMAGAEVPETPDLGKWLSTSWLQLALLVAGAAVPLIGVLSRSWSLREVVVLYWAENVIIGAFQIVKMATASPQGMAPAGHLAKLFLVPFFTVHYGGFCFVHGIFVFALTSGAFRSGSTPIAAGRPTLQLTEFPPAFWLALGLIGLHHLTDTVQRYFLQGRWQTVGLQELMSEPYKHIVVVHLGIILGAFLSIALGNAIGVLLVIVVGKFLIDVREIVQRRKAAAVP